MAAPTREPRRAPKAERPRGIRRRDPAASPVSFQSLREEGIRWTQALSGHTWTDYNLHDPGVTILEALCYGLTELAYRIDFPMADHLTGENGRIAFRQLALHEPAAVFPCRPTTVDDYRRALLDTISELDNAWIATDVATAGPDAGIDGLYRVAVKHADRGGDAAREAAIRAQVRGVFRANRNLGEDLAAVASVAPVDCELHGEFVIGGSRPPEDILADVYDRCALAIAAGVRFRPFGWAVERGQRIEDILNPRHTRHGVIEDEALRAAERDELFVGDLVAEVRAIEGIRAVRHLALARAGAEPTTGTLRWRAREEALRLRLPDDREMNGRVQLMRADGPVRVSAPEVRARYDERRRGQGTHRPGRQDIALHFPPPRGEHRDLRRHVSIQQHFPDVYGINERGLPASATPEERAQAAQLKAYLALFERILADGAAQLHHARDLFSTDERVRRSYWTQPLDDATIPGIGALLDGLAEVSAEARPDDHDDVIGRRNRVLDHLLALHGETFAQNTLRQLARYYGPGELEERLLANKLAYLRHVLRIGRDRAGAFDYGRPSWNLPGDDSPNVSGFQLRVSLLLGLRHAHSRSLTDGLRDEGLEVDGPDAGGRPAEAVAGGTSILVAEDDERFAPVPPLPPGGPVRLEELRAAHRIHAFDRGRISELVLRHGIDLANYRVGPVGGEHVLLFRPEGSPQSWLLSSHATTGAAWQAANRLQRFLVDVNREAEGLHVVEHVLLRPVGARPPAGAPLPAAFHSLRISVLFPAWTARGQDPAFRRFAEETVHLNCPGHVHPECLWLDFRAMALFEQRYERWLRAKFAATRPEADANAALQARAVAAADVAARAVALFLLEHGARADVRTGRA